MDAATALRTGATQTLLERFVARVTGEDPVAFLDATTSQDLSAMKPGESALTCMLDDKGRILAEMRATALFDGSVLLDAEQPARDAIVGWLATIAPLSACEVRDETDRWTFVAVRGAQAARALAVFEPLPDAGNAVERDGVIVIARAWGEPGFDVLGASRPDIDADDLSIDELDAARIAEGRPRFGIDFDAETHIAETPLIARAVSFTKGCYPGQESVARVQNLGRVRKRLVALDLGAPAEHGTVIVVDGSPVGAITSAAVFDGKPVAIAWLRSEVADGATVEVAGTPATVRAL